MGEYVLNSPMITIIMGGANIILGVQWLQSLGTVAFNFQEIFISNKLKRYVGQTKSFFKDSTS